MNQATDTVQVIGYISDFMETDLKRITEVIPCCFSGSWLCDPAACLSGRKSDHSEGISVVGVNSPTLEAF